MASSAGWITFVFDDSQEWSWFREPLFDEDQVRFELERMGVSPPPEERKRHVRFRLTEPLTATHYEQLRALQAQGLFARYYLGDEISQQPPLQKQ